MTSTCPRASRDASCTCPFTLPFPSCVASPVLFIVTFRGGRPDRAREFTAPPRHVSSPTPPPPPPQCSAGGLLLFMPRPRPTPSPPRPRPTRVSIVGVKYVVKRY